MNNRKNNTALEEALGGFLDEHLYEWLKSQNEGLEYERQTSLNMKDKGIDVIIGSGNTLLNIVERQTISSGYYYDNPTYCFEIDSINPVTGEVMIGELFDNHLLTHQFNIIWGDVKCDSTIHPGKYVRKDLNNLKNSDFTILESMFVIKAELIKFLESYGWNKEKLLERTKVVREDEDQKIGVGNEFFHFFYCPNIPHKPTYVAFTKPALYQLANRAYLVSETGPAVLKGKKIQ